MDATPAVSSSTPPRIPPGPRGLPLLGVALDVQKDVLGWNLRTAMEYGPVVQYRFGPLRSYLVTHPEGLKHVLQDHVKNYTKDHFGYAIIRRIVGNGIFTSEGATWLRQRSLSSTGRASPPWGRRWSTSRPWSASAPCASCLPFCSPPTTGPSARPGAPCTRWWPAPSPCAASIWRTMETCSPWSCSPGSSRLPCAVIESHHLCERWFPPAVHIEHHVVARREVGTLHVRRLELDPPGAFV